MSRNVILRLLDTYFRHRWLYLLPIGVMAVAGAVYLLNQQRLYISSGSVFTERDPLLSSLTSVNQAAASWNTPAQDTANQISELIQTDAFIRAIISETDLETEMSKGAPTVQKTLSKVRSHMWVWVMGSNQVQVSAAYTDPRISYQLARSAINTFILWNINRNRTDSTTAEDFFQGLIQNYQADVLAAQDSLRNYLVAHPEPLRGSRPAIEQFDIKNLQDQLDFAGTRLDHALEKAEDARLANAQIESTIRQKYTVVDAPNIPDRSTTSKRQMAMQSAIFLAIGALLSGIAVVGATVFDQTFRVPEEVPQLLDIPILAFLPDASPKRYGSWKRKALIPASSGGPLLEKTEEELSLPDSSQELSAPILTKSNRARKKKKQGTSDITPDQNANALDLPKSEDNSNPEQNIE